MNLGIALHGLFPGKIGGGEQYIRNLIDVAGRREDIQLFLFLNHDGIQTFEETENTKLFLIHVSQDIDAQLRDYIDELRINVWFCPLFHLQPVDCHVPSAVMIFDIQQEFYPRNFSLQELYLRKTFTARTVKSADLLLTISHFTKSTLTDKYGVNPEQIKVTWLDADKAFNNPMTEEDKERIKNTYKLPDEYIYFPANTWPHKNHMRLIKAYHLLAKQKRGVPKLLFTGASSSTHNKISKYIEKHRLTNNIIYLGYVAQEDMPYIFSNANMLVFPSLFEGFGIPLIEAMRVKIPVVCSNITSLPEIGGDAVCYFDGCNVKDIAEKIYKVYTNKEFRLRLTDEGERRARLFSWDICAKQTLRYLTELYQEQNKPVKTEQEFPLVSVITPSYNQGQFIRETIDSVLNQDYPNIEYIVTDGGSMDETVNILKSYGDRIKWVSEKDDGQGDAVNKGLRIANGEIIGWLNSDDTYTPGAVRKAVDYLNFRPNIDMVYGEGYYIDKDSNITGRYNTEKYSKLRLAETCFICQPSAFFRKSIVERAGEIDASLHLCMDYELWMRFAMLGRIAYTKDYLASSRMYAENKTSARRAEIFKEAFSSVKKHYGYIPLQWTYGYADYLCKGTRGWRFRLLSLMMFYAKNITNPKYTIKTTVKIAYKIFHRSKKAAPFDGKYLDKWLSKQYNTNVICREDCIAIRIMGQHVWPMDEDLKIDIFVDGVPMGDVSIEEKGDFQKIITLVSVIQPGFHQVQFNMNKTFMPSKSGLGPDKRNLSFILENLEMLPCVLKLQS